MNSLASYVCAFPGRRDDYQVPLALAEHGLLERFITDVYATPAMRALLPVFPSSLRRMVEFRYKDALPDDRIQCLWGVFAYERIHHALGKVRSVTHAKADRFYSYAARQAAQKRSCNLFLYSSYAWEAFTSTYSHTPRKVMLQYHPHPEMIRRILKADPAKHLVKTSHDQSAYNEFPEALYRRERDAWKYADCIVCASSFTRQSLLEAGADPTRCKVIPYGIALSDEPEATTPEGFHALFVGSGGQRKGLHHLLLAWRMAQLPRDSQLTLVCRSIDPELERIANETPGVRLHRGVTFAHLDSLFKSSTLFIMPSLVEGFGFVFLEALARSCPVLGTKNTALPDLGTSKEGVFTVSPGDTEQLASEISRLSGILPGNRGIRVAAREVAKTFSWPSFRGKIAGLLNEPY